MISSSLFNAFGKVQGLTNKVSPSDEKPKDATEEEAGDKAEEAASGSGGFFSAITKMGGNIPGISSSGTVENLAAAANKSSEDDTGAVTEENDDKRKETWGNSFTNAFNKVGKVATDYSKGRCDENS